MPDKTIEDYRKKFKNLLLNQKSTSSQLSVKEQQEVILDFLKAIGRTSASSITIQNLLAKEFGTYLDKKQAREISRRFFKENVSTSDKKKTGILSYRTQIQKFKESPLFNLKILPLTAENTKVVLQREFRITSAREAQPFIATFGFNTCSVVILYQQDSQKASLAHIDAKAALYSLQPFVEKSFGGKNNCSKTHITVLGGIQNEVFHLCQQLENMNFRNITAVSWEENEFPSRKIAIDSRDGRLCSFMSSYSIMTPADRKRHDDFELYRLWVHSPLSFVDQVIAGRNNNSADNSDTAGALQIINPKTNKIESLITPSEQSPTDKENATGYIWAFVQPQQFALPRVKQSQMGRVIRLPIVQQQSTNALLKVAGAKTFRFSPSFNTSSQTFSQVHTTSIVEMLNRIAYDLPTQLLREGLSNNKDAYVELACKMTYRQSSLQVNGRFLNQKNTRPFTLNFAGQHSYPAMISVIYAHPEDKNKYYVVNFNMAKQRDLVNDTYHAKRGVENWSKWEIDPISYGNRLSSFGYAKNNGWQTQNK